MDDVDLQIIFGAGVLDVLALHVVIVAAGYFLQNMEHVFGVFLSPMLNPFRAFENRLYVKVFVNKTETHEIQNYICVCVCG